MANLEVSPQIQSRAAEHGDLGHSPDGRLGRQLSSELRNVKLIVVSLGQSPVPRWVVIHQLWE